jgi:CLIP-associating protein 1/2
MRPYLSLLVDCLEDTDPHVRDCARHSIVELFLGPAVTDAARADLKKEMTKKGVRKTIVDSVLMKLLNGTPATSASQSQSQSHEGSENGDATAPKEYIPPSLMLQGRRPRVGSQSAGSQTGGHVRSGSQGSAKEASRPASRAAMTSPPPVASSSESSEVPPVFVRVPYVRQTGSDITE